MAANNLIICLETGELKSLDQLARLNFKKNWRLKVSKI